MIYKFSLTFKVPPHHNRDAISVTLEELESDDFLLENYQLGHVTVDFEREADTETWAIATATAEMLSVLQQFDGELVCASEVEVEDVRLMQVKAYVTFVVPETDWQEVDFQIHHMAEGQGWTVEDIEIK